MFTIVCISHFEYGNLKSHSNIYNMLLLRPRENLIAPVWIMFLYTPLVVCLSEINASESSSSLIQHAYIMFSYLYTIFNH